MNHPTECVICGEMSNHFLVDMGSNNPPQNVPFCLVHIHELADYREAEYILADLCPRAIIDRIETTGVAIDDN